MFLKDPRTSCLTLELKISRKVSFTPGLISNFGLLVMTMIEITPSMAISIRRRMATDEVMRFTESPHAVQLCTLQQSFPFKVSVSYFSSMVFMENSLEVSIDLHGFSSLSMVFPSFSMVFPWFSHRFSMVFPWFFHGFPHGKSHGKSHVQDARPGRGAELRLSLSGSGRVAEELELSEPGSLGTLAPGDGKIHWVGLRPSDSLGFFP